MVLRYRLSQWVVSSSGKSRLKATKFYKVELEKRRTSVRLFYVQDVLYAAGAWMHRSGDVHERNVCRLCRSI